MEANADGSPSPFAMSHRMFYETFYTVEVVAENDSGSSSYKTVKPPKTNYIGDSDSFIQSVADLRVTELLQTAATIEWTHESEDLDYTSPIVDYMITLEDEDAPSPIVFKQTIEQREREARSDFSQDAQAVEGVSGWISRGCAQNSL